MVFFLLSMRVRARPWFLSTVFPILFRISQSNGKNRYLSIKIRFRISRSIANPKSVFQNLNPDFPIERTLRRHSRHIPRLKDHQNHCHHPPENIKGFSMFPMFKSEGKLGCFFSNRNKLYRVRKFTIDFP